jgi:hypothetical protein
MRKIYIAGALTLMFAACKPSASITTPITSGTADFSNYLAIGNSLTAGYTDGSLTLSGQLNSYPERLFEQFSMVSGSHAAKGPFIQPLLMTDNGYPGARYVLGMTYNSCIASDSSLGPISDPNFVSSTSAAQNGTYTNPTSTGQINNIGVPGIRIADYDVPGYGAANPYAARFYHDLTKTPLDELQYRVGNLIPTFFTMWLGANDVLGYALAGGQGNGVNATPAITATNYYNTSDITPANVFDSLYDKVLNMAISTSAGGALINIPDVTSIPYFTTIPANGLTLARQTQADSLEGYWGNGNFNKVFQVGANYFIIQDNNGLTRQAVPGELILFTVPQDSITCAGWGSYKPIPKQYVLTTDELQNIRAATTSFNTFIKYEASRHNLAYVDMNTYLGTLNSGIVFNGVSYSAQFVTGGAFSLDGIHLTQRGYALVANQILAAINAQYGSNVPMVDANKYHGVSFPNSN